MPGYTSMAIGAGPLYTNAVMGQSPSATERENARKASSSILRRKSIQIEESENCSRPESSWSMHFDCTDQAPYAATEDDIMLTQTSLLRLPRDNPSHDLAEFLRTTGPTANHRRPSKLEQPQPISSVSRNALKFLKFRPRRPQTSVAAAHKRLNNALLDIQDEGGLLGKRRIKQKVSAEGTKYLALEIGDAPNILDSEVSVAVFDGRSEQDSFEDWRAVRRDKPHRRAPTPGVKRTFSLPFDDEATIVAESQASPDPVRPAASNPPSPDPQSAISLSESSEGRLMEQAIQTPHDVSDAVASHPLYATTSASLPLPDKSPSEQDFALQYEGEVKDVELKQPSPRRLASHPVLLQRASSITCSFPPRSVSDSPGPPPKSPLRLRREPRNIVEVLAVDSDRKPTPKVAPSIMTVSEYNCEPQIMKSTVVTECSGPIKRPKSRSKSSRIQAAFSGSRKEREERIRARKLRDRPITAKTIEAIVNAPPQPPRQRLRKARPTIQVPEKRPPVVTTRASSNASSHTSWKKVTEYPHTSMPGDAYSETPNIGDTTVDAVPTSPTFSKGSGTEVMTLSSVILVAEERPTTKTKISQRSSKIITKEGKSYAPRPRSASIPRASMRRRSRQASRTPSRPGSPNRDVQNDDAPPLPSAPPTKALPPPPLTLEVPNSTSAKQLAFIDNQKQLPCTPLHDVAPNAPSLKRSGKLPHVATQTQRKRVLPREPNATVDDVNLRLEALEKNNALLSAALTAVLRTNGALNSLLPSSPLNSTTQAEVETVRAPMAWESRIARRSAASQGASSKNSEGDALDLYMSTRRGSRHGL